MGRVLEPPAAGDTETEALQKLLFGYKRAREEGLAPVNPALEEILSARNSEEFFKDQGIHVPGLTDSRDDLKSQEITPEPFYFVKTCDMGGQKVFINMCGCSEVAAPGHWQNGVPPELDESFSLMESRAEDGMQNLRFSLSCSDYILSTDKQGNLCTVYDVVFNLVVMRHSKVHKQLRTFLINMAMTWINQKYNVELQQDFKLPKGKYKGDVVRKHHIRAAKAHLITEVIGTEYVSMDFKDNSGDKLDETFTPFKFTYSHGSVVGDVKTIETTDTRRHSINKVVLEKTPEQAKEVTDVGEEDIVLTLAKQPAKSNLGFQDDGSASSGTPIGVEKNIPAHTPTAVEKNIPADTPKRRGTRSDPEWEEVDVQLQSPMRSPPKRSALEPPAESPSKCKDALEPPAKSPERCIGKRRSRNITSPRNTQRSRAAKNKKVPSERNQDPPKEAPTGNEDEEDVYLSSMFEAIRSKPSRKFVS